jgi:hypothetical protein
MLRGPADFLPAIKMSRNECCVPCFENMMLLCHHGFQAGILDDGLARSGCNFIPANVHFIYPSYVKNGAEFPVWISTGIFNSPHFSQSDQAWIIHRDRCRFYLSLPGPDPYTL